VAQGKGNARTSITPGRPLQYKRVRPADTNRHRRPRKNIPVAANRGRAGRRLTCLRTPASMPDT
jgi:hypothetical protein